MQQCCIILEAYKRISMVIIMKYLIWIYNLQIGNICNTIFKLHLWYSHTLRTTYYTLSYNNWICHYTFFFLHRNSIGYAKCMYAWRINRILCRSKRCNFNIRKITNAFPVRIFFPSSSKIITVKQLSCFNAHG